MTSEEAGTSDRDFTGVEHVRKNWTDLFAQVPDLRIGCHTIAGDIGWSEWHWQGKRTNGTELNMKGVVVELRETRSYGLYMEPVQSLK